MRIHIDKSSAVPVFAQISEQIAMHIATGEIKAGTVLPSYRDLERRLMISRATIGRAYKDLLSRGRIQRHRGAKMVVCPLDWPFDSQRGDLDDLIDATILKARERGYTLQDLRKCLRERLLIEPPDHVLIVEEEQEMRQLLRQELSEMLRFTINVTSPAKIAENQGPVIGVLVVC